MLFERIDVWSGIMCAVPFTLVYALIQCYTYGGLK